MRSGSAGRGSTRAGQLRVVVVVMMVRRVRLARIPAVPEQLQSVVERRQRRLLGLAHHRVAVLAQAVHGAHQATRLLLVVATAARMAIAGMVEVGERGGEECLQLGLRLLQQHLQTAHPLQDGVQGGLAEACKGQEGKGGGLVCLGAIPGRQHSTYPLHAAIA